MKSLRTLISWAPQAISFVLVSCGANNAPRNCELRGIVAYGALPDMLSLTPDGKYVLTADEGEASEDDTIDPEVWVSVMPLPN